MPTPREIKRRIRSVKNIAQVTGALEAVSASKVRRAQSQALASRVYSNAARAVLRSLHEYHEGGVEHPLIDARPEINNVLIILITSDRGLAGPYNTNVIREAIRFEKQIEAPISYLTVGRKGRDLMLRRGANIVAEYSDLPATPSVLDVTPIIRTAMDDFLDGTVDEVYVLYTDFVNTLQQKPSVHRLLPLIPNADAEETAPSGPRPVFAFEPNAQTILEEILPRFAEVLFFQDLLEALASEHSARMVAMRSATENANALVDDLTLSYNKARQLAITSEMLDIVGGAEALAQSQAD